MVTHHDHSMRMMDICIYCLRIDTMSSEAAQFVLSYSTLQLCSIGTNYKYNIMKSHISRRVPPHLYPIRVLVFNMRLKIDCTKKMKDNPSSIPCGPQLGPSWARMGPGWARLGPIWECCLGSGLLREKQSKTEHWQLVSVLTKVFQVIVFPCLPQQVHRARRDRRSEQPRGEKGNIH